MPDASASGHPDLAELCAAFGRELRGAGVRVPAERISWWARVITMTRPVLVRELYWTARVTLLDGPHHLPVFDAVFAWVFRGISDVADFRGQEPPPALASDRQPGEPGSPGESSGGGVDPSRPGGVSTRPTDDASDDGDGTASLAYASEHEVLRQRDFADCSADELAELNRWIGRMRVVAPTRPSRWIPARSGRQLDLRRTLRAACRTGGDPVHWVRRTRGRTPRRIVLLADVSGSMEPYARMYLRVLHGAVVGARAQAYVFATRLTPVTRVLRRAARETAVAAALTQAPDAIGGTRIGPAIKTFLDTDGRRGVARGSVVVIVSDGWERGDPAHLAEQMARLRRLAHRVIWVNPRRAAPGFAPLTGGMAAALPHVDVFVDGHSARAVEDLLAAIAAG